MTRPEPIDQNKANIPSLISRAQELRHSDTLAEKLAWKLLRNRHVLHYKFRRASCQSVLQMRSTNAKKGTMDCGTDDAGGGPVAPPGVNSDAIQFIVPKLRRESCLLPELGWLKAATVVQTGKARAVVSDHPVTA